MIFMKTSKSGSFFYLIVTKDIKLLNVLLLRKSWVEMLVKIW